LPPIIHVLIDYGIADVNGRVRAFVHLNEKGSKPEDNMQNNEQKIASDENSLKDIVGFFKRNKLLIMIGGLAGLLFSTAYILLAQEKYEARWQLQMAQFVNVNGNGNVNGNNNSNSEDPSALIQRLRMPTSYPKVVQESCGVQEDGNADEYLNKKLKIEVVKNVVNAVDMKVTAPSTVQAKKCAEELVAMIVAQQQDIIEERMAGRQEQLKDYQHALREEQKQLDTIKKTEIGNFGYLAKLDTLSWLRTRIDAMQEESFLSQKHPAKLLTPIYVPSKPVSPKVGPALLVGVMLGLMLGLAYAMGREGWRKAGMQES